MRRGSGFNDHIRHKIAEHLRKQIKEIEAKNIPQQQIDIIIKTVNKLIDDGSWEPVKGEKFIAGVKDGSFSIQFALKALQAYVTELETPAASISQTTEEAEKKGVAAYIFAVLKKTLNFKSSSEPDAAYFDAMAAKYNISKEHALQIYKDAPVGENAAQTAQEFASVFNQSVLKDAWQTLQQTAENMVSGQQEFTRYLEMEQVMQTQLNEQLDKINIAGTSMSSAIDRL